MQVLPGMQQAANEAGDIGYTTPEGWVEKPASGIRKANFKSPATQAAPKSRCSPSLVMSADDWPTSIAGVDKIGLEDATAEDLPAYTQGYEI